MADSAIIVRWGFGIPGREAKGLEVFQQAMSYFGGLVEKGELESSRTYLNETGNVWTDGGSMVLEGSDAQIDALQKSDEFRSMVLRGSHIANNFMVNRAATGNTIMKRVEHLISIRKELGLM
jgi:hypothetical protein